MPAVPPAGWSRFSGRMRGPRGGWQVCRIIRAGPGPEARPPRSLPGRRGTPPGARRCGAGAPGRRSARSASTRSALASIPTSRHDPEAAGARSATSASHVDVGSGQTQLGLEPELPGGLGQQVADPHHRSAPRLHPTPRTSGSPRAPADPAAGPTSVAPSGPASTAQLEPAARSPGSRSPSVVVVTNAWGSSAIRRTRWARRSGSSSLNTSSSRRSGGRSSSAVRTSSSASLKARIAVRCWPREANPARSRPSSSNARSSRCGPMSVVPFQTSFSAVSASRRASASRDRLAGSRRRVRLVADGQPALLGRDLGVGPAERFGDRLERGAGGPRRRPPRRSSSGGVPEAQLVASGECPRGSTGAGRCAAGARGRRSPARPRTPATGCAARVSIAARRGPGAPATRSMSSGAKRTARSTPARLDARRATPLTRIRLRCPPAPSRTRATSIVAGSAAGPARSDPALDAGDGRCPSG